MKPDNSVVAILATDYINNVLAIRATNTLARVRATPVVLAPLVAVSIPPAPAPLATNGKQKKEVINGPDGEVYKCNGKVVGVRATGMGFYVAMKDLGYMGWSNANNQCQNYSFCSNVKGTLPTVDQLKSIYQNKSRVNSLLSTNGGTQLTNSYYWSSNGNSYTTYYIVDMSSGSVGGSVLGRYYVRPVLASW